MDFLITLFLKTLLQVWTTFVHNWPFLIVSVLVAVALKLYLDPQKVSKFLMRYRKAGVVGATAAAVATPLCSCGTTAIVLGMMAGMMPWAPIVAFMVASPLTSPEELIYSAGLFGWPFALAFFIASILLGLLGGLAAGLAENRGWLANQTRLAGTAVSGARSAPRGRIPQPSVRVYDLSEPALAVCGCGSPVMEVSAARPNATLNTAGACGCGGAVTPVKSSAFGCYASAGCEVSAGCVASAGCGTPAVEPCESGCSCRDAAPVILPGLHTESACGCSAAEQSKEAAPAAASGGCSCSGESGATEQKKAGITPRVFLTEALDTGKRLLVMFLGFAFIGYFLNGLIPSAWVAAIFGAGHAYSIPLAATLGLPLYVNTEASLPLVRALIDGGMSQGAALAFLITGAGTSFGAIAGALTIARWRVIALVIGTLWVGAVAIGFLYNLLIGMGVI